MEPGVEREAAGPGEPGRCGTGSRVWARQRIAATMPESRRDPAKTRGVRMMICKKCGWDTQVIQTQRGKRELAPGNFVEMVRRRRKCLRCGLTFITCERREDDPQELWQSALDAAEREWESAEQRVRRIAGLVTEIVQEQESSGGRERGWVKGPRRRR